MHSNADWQADVVRVGKAARSRRTFFAAMTLEILWEASSFAQRRRKESPRQLHLCQLGPLFFAVVQHISLRC
jgi:hypothetical protein